LNFLSKYLKPTIMIRVTPTSLVIEIESKNHSPLFVLQQLQQGLIDMLGVCATADEAPKAYVQNSLQNIHLLLSEMNFGEM